MPEDKVDKVKRFQKLVKSRNESANQKILSWIEAFIDREEAPNPQKRLNSYGEAAETCPHLIMMGRHSYCDLHKSGVENAVICTILNCKGG